MSFFRDGNRTRTKRTELEPISFSKMNRTEWTWTVWQTEPNQTVRLVETNQTELNCQTGRNETNRTEPNWTVRLVETNRTEPNWTVRLVETKRTEPNWTVRLVEMNRTEPNWNNAQWVSCKNAARNAWETDVSQVQYVTDASDVFSINCESFYDVPVLWLLKAVVL